MKLYKNRRAIALVFGLAMAYTSNGQHTRFSLGIHYATFKMGDLVQLQAEFLKDLDGAIPARVTDNFPSYIGFEGSLTFRKDPVWFGAEVGYNSTAGRIAYSDYSGKFFVDQIVKAPKVGLAVAYTLSKNVSDWETLIYFNAGTTFNSYKVDYNLTTAKTHHVDVLQFQSINIYVSGGVGVSRNFSRFFINTKVLYQQDIPTDLTLSSDSNAKLTNDDGDFVQVDWSGLRPTLSVGMKIGSS
jgi:hypothetical protein